MLRKPDPRRQLTQTWRFTDDGRLCCGHNNVFVQAKDGFYGVRQGISIKTISKTLLLWHCHIFWHRYDGSINISQASPITPGECVRRI
jgi:hypothetical protein